MSPWLEFLISCSITHLRLWQGIQSAGEIETTNKYITRARGEPILVVVLSGLNTCSWWAIYHELDVLSMSARSTDVKLQLNISQDIQIDAPNWLLTIAAAGACWHTSTRSGTINTCLMCYLLMSPNSAYPTVLGMPEFFVVLLKGYWIVASKKQAEFADMTKVVEADLRSWTGASHVTSADGSRFGACLSICGVDSDAMASVWVIFRGVLDAIQLLVNILGPCGKGQGVKGSWSASPWSWSLREHSFTSESSFNAIFNRCRHILWVWLLLPQTWRTTH